MSPIRSAPIRRLYAALLPALASLPLFSSCASYRYLALPASDASSSSASLGYETTRLFLFHGRGDDALVERVYASPRDGGVLVATVLWPASGVIASSDQGATWSFTALPLDDHLSPRVLREVLFDPADPNRIYARAFNGLVVSSDGGKSWTRQQVGERKRRAVDALALGPDGTLYVAVGDALFASEDHGESFLQLPLVIPIALATLPQRDPAEKSAEDVKPDPVRIRAVLPDPQQPKTIYVSIEQEPPAENFQRRLIGLLDQTTDEGAKARAMLKLPADKPLDKLSFGDARAGVWSTRDGGRSWQKSSLGVDSWLSAQEGAVYAVAAEPLLTAAGLVQQSPELAAAIDAQLHENGFDPESLRRACAWPGREKLLAAAPAAPVFRSADQGNSWSRVAGLPLPLALALRRDLDVKRVGRDPWRPRPVKKAPEEHDLHTDLDPNQPAPRPGSRRGGGGHAMRAAPKEEPAPPDLTEPLLSLLDPASLLSHLGPGIPLSAIAGPGAAALWAYAPTAAYWAQLTESLVRATKREGELSLGGSVEVPEGGSGFELLFSDDGGRSLRAIPAAVDPLGVLSARAITPYPAAVAVASTQGIFLLSGRDKLGQPWRALLREQPVAAGK